MENHGKIRKPAGIDSDFRHTPAAKAERFCYAFDEFRVDATTTRLFRHGDPVTLPSRAFDALVYLIEHRDRLVGKDELISAIWHDVAVTDDSLVHAISSLRRTLGDDHNAPRYIETIPRRGYRFIANVTGDHGGEGDNTVEPAAGQRDASSSQRHPMASRRGGRFRLALAMVAAAAVAAVAAALLLPGLAPAPGPGALSAAHVGMLRFEQAAPPGTRIISGGVLSPDGRQLAFIARDDDTGATAIWVRSLASGEFIRLNGTAGASHPFWSPDARNLGFFANGSLVASSVAAEQSRTIARVGLNAAGGSWSTDDRILFAIWSDGIYAVPASGGTAPVTIRKLDRAADDIAMSRPQFLPDGRHFLFHVASLQADRTGTFVGNLDTTDDIRLIASESPAVFAPPNHLLHVSGSVLIAERFDADSLEISGHASVAARGVSTPSLLANDFASASGNLLAFQDGVRTQNLAWFDRAGNATSNVTTPAVLYNPRVSPDQSQLLATSSITSDPGLWLASLEREQFARLERDAIAPLWSPDGRLIAFTARGGFDLFVRDVGTGNDKRLLVSGETVKILNDWTHADPQIVYTQPAAQTGLDIWSVAVSSGISSPLLATAHNEMQARISPDGGWIAYASDESGWLEVYVDRYPALDRRRRISVGGGGQPQWRTDQHELFYLSANRDLMTVDVQSDRNDDLAFGAPRPLFRAPIAADPASARDHYAAAEDGSQFLFDSSTHGGNGTKITIVANWIGNDAAMRIESSQLDGSDSTQTR